MYFPEAHGRFWVLSDLPGIIMIPVDAEGNSRFTKAAYLCFMQEPVYVLDYQKINTTSYMVSIYDHDLKVKFCKPLTEIKFSIPSVDSIGKCLTSLFPGYDKDFRFQVMKDAVTQRKSFYFPDLPYQYRQGSYSQLVIPVAEGIAIISSDNDGTTAIPRRELMEAVCAQN